MITDETLRESIYNTLLSGGEISQTYASDLVIEIARELGIQVKAWVYCPYEGTSPCSPKGTPEMIVVSGKTVTFGYF
jgi:hypothetical protein